PGRPGRVERRRPPGDPHRQDPPHRAGRKVVMTFLVDAAVARRLERLEVPFDRYGVDPFGISRAHLGRFYTMLGWLYRRYFDVTVNGIEHVPVRGRAMLVGNHSGGVALDGAMVLASLFFDMD